MRRSAQHPKMETIPVCLWKSAGQRRPVGGNVLRVINITCRRTLVVKTTFISGSVLFFPVFRYLYGYCRDSKSWTLELQTVSTLPETG